MELEIALSRYFGVREPTIHADVLEISKSLGPNWYQDLEILRQFTGDQPSSHDS